MQSLVRDICKQVSPAGDRVRRHHGRPRCRSGDAAWGGRRPARNGLSALPGVGRTGNLQARPSRCENRRDRHHPRILRPAGARHRQHFHRHAGRQAACHPAIPAAERSDASDAQCSRGEGRSGLHFAVGRARRDARHAPCRRPSLSKRWSRKAQSWKSPGRSSIGVPCGVRSQACSQASRVRARACASVMPFSATMRSSAASQWR